MNIVDKIFAAYGGERWNDVTTISAHKIFGGATWPMKQVPGILDDGHAEVSVQSERVRFSPFQSPDLAAVFTPDQVKIVDSAGITMESLENPRASFDGHTLSTPWTPLQLAYFGGYALWTYLTEPYSLRLPGVVTEEAGSWAENGQTWQRLNVRYPSTFATHSADQTLYIDADGLIRRRDYTVDVLADAPGAHYVTAHEQVDGIVIGTERTVYARDENDNPIAEPVLVSIALDGITTN